MTRDDNKITFRVTTAMLTHLRRLSEDRGVSMGFLLREIIRSYLERQS